MKKIGSKILVVTFILLSSMVFAQSPIDKVFEKYAGQDGFTTVNFSKEMFQMFAQMSMGSDSSAAEFKKMADQITGLKVLMYNFDSTGIVKAVGIYNEFAGQFPASQYKELMSVNEGRQYVKFMTKQDPAGKIHEFVMLMKDKDEVGVISLTGVIDLNSISKLTKGMNIKGMENLQKMK